MIDLEPRCAQAKRRIMLVTRDIADALDGTSAPSGFPDAGAATINDRYMIGHMISMSRTRSRDAVLKQIEGADAVWSFAYRTPKPGWRLLGRFLERDVFVGLSLQSRGFLGRVRDAFTDEAGAVVRSWEHLLPGLDPVRSRAFNDHLTDPIWDFDADA